MNSAFQRIVAVDIWNLLRWGSFAQLQKTKWDLHPLKFKLMIKNIYARSFHTYSKSHDILCVVFPYPLHNGLVHLSIKEKPLSECKVKLMQPTLFTIMLNREKACLCSLCLVFQSWVTFFVVVNLFLGMLRITVMTVSCVSAMRRKCFCVALCLCSWYSVCPCQTTPVLTVLWLPLII